MGVAVSLDRGERYLIAGLIQTLVLIEFSVSTAADQEGTGERGCETVKSAMAGADGLVVTRK